MKGVLKLTKTIAICCVTSQKLCTLNILKNGNIDTIICLSPSFSQYYYESYKDLVQMVVKISNDNGYNISKMKFKNTTYYDIIFYDIDNPISLYQLGV